MCHPGVGDGLSRQPRIPRPTASTARQLHSSLSTDIIGTYDDLCRPTITPGNTKETHRSNRRGEKRMLKRRERWESEGHKNNVFDSIFIVFLQSTTLSTQKFPCGV